MPATTGISAIPAGRPGAELQAGFAPGFYLSQAAADRARGLRPLTGVQVRTSVSGSLGATVTIGLGAP